MKVFVSIIFICVLAQGAKILFVTMPDGKSHWGSMLPLAKRLAKDGHEVSVYMEVIKPTSLSPEFISYLVELKNIDMKEPHENTDFADMLWNSDYGPINQFFPWYLSYICNKHVIENQPNDFLRVTNKTWDLIMVDSLFTISGMAMVQKLTSPYAIYLTSIVETNMAYHLNLRLSSATQPPLYLTNDNPTWTADSFWDRLFAVKQDSISLGVRMGPVQWMLYKSGNPGWAAHVGRSSGSFSDAVESFDWTIPRSNELFYTGSYCPLPETIKPLPEALGKFVSDPKSAGTIIVAFGTIANWALAPKEKLMAMIDALKQLTDYKVIWAYKGTDLHLPSHIKTMAWLPQNDLLNHKRTKLFVSHGGLKSGNATEDAPVVEGEVSIVLTVFYGFCGIVAISLNILSLKALPRCEKLEYSTLAMMRCQCIMNIIGLLPKTFINPIVCATGHEFPYQKWGPVYNIPGALLVMAIYGQFALQALVAFNRLTAFRYHAKYASLFDKGNTKKWISLAISHGIWNFVMCMFPCCPVYFNPQTHSWGYGRWGSDLRKIMTVISDAIATPIVTVCYGMAFWTVRNMGSTISSHEMSVREMKREMRLLIQFFTIACTWIAYSVVYRPISLVPSISNRTGVVFASEMVRFWMFSVDPTIYMIFMKRLRNEVIKMVTFGKVDNVRKNSAVPYRSNVGGSVAFSQNPFLTDHTGIRNLPPIGEPNNDNRKLEVTSPFAVATPRPRDMRLASDPT